MSQIHNTWRLTRRTFGFLACLALKLGIPGWAARLKADESGAGLEKRVESIIGLGGEVERDESCLASKPVVSVNFDQTRITDGDLECLRGLTELRKLSLEDIQMTDAGMARLSELVKLESVNLRDTVSDTGISRLVALQQLRDLNLSYTPIGDAGIAHLVALPHLRRLALDGTKITDAALGRLRVLPNLESIRLGYTKITDFGLRSLAGLVCLRELGLGHQDHR